jgi:hypothetical protein
MLWHMMRMVAIARHRAVWIAEGAKPETWPAHMALIRAVYGY